jgi:DNA-binding transcriptional LysR family regulator
MLELRHLRYFVAVAEERNFSRAAERLHMAQSPLSAAIRQLEQEIGAELLARGSRGVTMTAAGGVLLDRARRILEAVDGAITATRRAASGELGVLRIAFSWSARFGTLPALSQRFASGYPDVTVVTQEMWNADMPRALRSATIDLAISLCPERDSELAYELLRRERVVALTPEGHPLAGMAGLSGWRTSPMRSSRCFRANSRCRRRASDQPARVSLGGRHRNAHRLQHGCACP